MDLENLRGRIDEIDDQILKLFLRRMETAKLVARYKVEHDLPVLNEKREQEILKSVAERAGQYQLPAHILFSTMMDVSRASQYSFMQGGKELRTLIENAVERESPAPAVVACSGVDGAYASIAASRLYPDAELRFYQRFEDAFLAVQNGKSDCAMIPIENSLAGSVIEVYDLMLKYRLFIRDSIVLPISHCLLAVEGAEMGDIRRVASHPQALAQCSEMIERHGFVGSAVLNTAGAAKEVAEKGEVSTAAIASEKAAGIYGLKILQRDIQNAKDNFTRFICISKTLCISPDASRFSVTFALPHVTGSLYRILSRFAVHGLNLTKIESRPIRAKTFEYLFYLDCEGSLRTKENLNLLCALSEELPEFAFLGNYTSE